nr:Crp/Fnr family transcriptional regulator [Cohnella sp. GbtcB17]
MNLKELVEQAPEPIKRQFLHRKHRNGSLILHPNESNDYLHILTKGTAEVYSQSYSGAMLSLYINKAYSCFGEIEIFDESLKSFGVVAKQNCETIAVHKTSVYEWMKADFNFTFFLIKQLASKVTFSSETTSQLSLLKLKERILISIHNHYKIGDLHALTKQVLASEVCAPLRSLNRSLAECKTEGLIQYESKKFSIPSVPELETYLEHYLLR